MKRKYLYQFYKFSEQKLFQNKTSRKASSSKYFRLLVSDTSSMPTTQLQDHSQNTSCRYSSTYFKVPTYVLAICCYIGQVSASCSVMSDSSRPHELQPTRLLCPWNSPGKKTGVGSHSLLQGIFLTQGMNQGLLHCRQILYHLNHQGSLIGAQGCPKC